MADVYFRDGPDVTWQDSSDVDWISLTGTVVIGVVNVTIAGQALTVEATNNIDIVVGNGGITTTGYVPVIDTSGHLLVVDEDDMMY